jgi:hypothetical protein
MNIYAISTHHKARRDRLRAAEFWKEDEVCAVGYRWTFKEEWGDEPCTDRFQLFLEISKGDVILAYSSGNTIAYVGEVADGILRTEKKNKTGSIYKYWNQLRVSWWAEPNHFDRSELPPWIRRQLGKRGPTITRLDLKNHSFKEARSTIRTTPTSGSALAQHGEEMVKAGLRNYFLSHVPVFYRGWKIHLVEKDVASGHRPDFEGQDVDGRPVIIECKGLARPSACEQLARYAATYRKKHRGAPTPRLLLVAFRFQEACRKLANKAGIELFRCKLQLIRER